MTGPSGSINIPASHVDLPQPDASAMQTAYALSNHTVAASAEPAHDWQETVFAVQPGLTPCSHVVSHLQHQWADQTIIRHDATVEWGDEDGYFAPRLI